MILEWSDHPDVIEWLTRRTPNALTPHLMQCLAMHDGKDMVAVVGYFNYTPRNVEMAIAAEGPWATRHRMREIFRYPFEFLKVERVTACTGDDNAKAIRLLEKSGFVLEGKLRGWLPSGDCRIYGMLQRECKW